MIAIITHITAGIAAQFRFAAAVWHDARAASAQADRDWYMIGR
jgi:hypothetical protein